MCAALASHRLDSEGPGHMTMTPHAIPSVSPNDILASAISGSGDIERSDPHEELVVAAVCKLTPHANTQPEDFPKYRHLHAELA